MYRNITERQRFQQMLTTLISERSNQFIQRITGETKDKKEMALIVENKPIFSKTDSYFT